MKRDEALAEKMNLLTEVVWDRWGGWYEHDVEEGENAIFSAQPFGWIRREDGRFDFFVLTVFWTAADGIYHVASVTSSARYSEEFSKRLHGDEVEHLECRRVEHDPIGEFVVRKVELENVRLDDGPADRPYERPARTRP